MPLSLFRNRTVLAACLVTALNFFVLIGCTVLLPLSMQTVGGARPDEVALRLIALTLGLLVGLTGIDLQSGQPRFTFGAAELLDGYMMRYIESQAYQAVVENLACEMAARMVAMKSATDNAGKLIDELQLIYNKARQAAITKEISEIVGGAAAV